MKIQNIRAVRNGYVASAQDSHWDYDKDDIVVTEFELIGPNLRELVDMIEPQDKTQDYTSVDMRDLKRAEEASKAGRKIEAIKIVRSAFTPIMSLKAAKDLVETLWPTIGSRSSNIDDNEVDC